MKKASHAGRKRPRRAAEAAAAIRRRCGESARLGIILGSGFQDVPDGIVGRIEVPFSRVPGFPRPSVAGHRGRVIHGTLGGVEVILLAGRVHYYEGNTMEEVTFGVRVLAHLGVESLLITNAAGGLNPRFRVGNFMMLTDHINCMGANPLRGASPSDRSRFVDLTATYDPELQSLLRRAARRVRIPLKEGIYLAVSGPSYETPAEIRAFRRMGADAIGMSTVPEAIAARQEGMRVAGLSCITNLAAATGGPALNHEDVLRTGTRMAFRSSQLLQHFATLHGTP